MSSMSLQADMAAGNAGIVAKPVSLVADSELSDMR
jgi:hypothetical protein